jgi:hypothetical protein
VGAADRSASVDRWAAAVAEAKARVAAPPLTVESLAARAAALSCPWLYLKNAPGRQVYERNAMRAYSVRSVDLEPGRRISIR